MTEARSEHSGAFEDELPAQPPALSGQPTRSESVDDPGPPKSAWETPRGWTDDEWAEKNFGKSQRRSPWSSLDIGKGWLLAAVWAGVLVLLLVLILELRGSL